MSDEETRLPSHDVFHVRGTGKTARWSKPLGAVWPHKDGKGFNIELDALPITFDGKLVLRERPPKKDDDAQDGDV